MRLLLADAVDLVGDRHAPARGPRKLGLGPEDIVRDLVHQLGHDEPLPPQHTNHAAYLPILASFIVSAARRWNRPVLLLVDGFCAPDCPEPCLQVVSWLIQSINNLVSQPPIRIVALGFDPGPRAPRQLVQLLQTAPDLPSWDELRIQCLHALEQAGIRRSAAAELFDADWPPAPGPPPINRIHTHVQRYPCALVPPPGFHMTRYYGVLASHHRRRERAIPKPAAQSPTPTPSPNPPRRPRSPCASSSWTGPVALLTARPFGRFVTLALPLALDRAKIPRPRTPAAPRASPYSSSPPNSYFKTLKRTHTHPDPRVLQPGGERADVEVEGDVAIH